MHPQIEDFLARPLWQRVLAWVVALIFVGYGSWSFLCAESFAQKAKLEEELEKLNTDVAYERRLARDLGKFRREVKELAIKLKFALQELPDKKEIPDLLSSVSNLARDAGLEVSLFKPQGENYKDFYAEVPVVVSVDGGYHQVATFFDEVGRLPRIVNLSSIAMSAPKISDAGVTIRTDCIATTFRYLEESERQKADAEADKKRRKK